MALKYEYVRVDMMDLLLDPENPRFASSELVKKSGSISQDIIIEHLLKYAKVSGLSNRINHIKGLHGGDLITCYKKDGKYIVLEGNRRVCACKLLLNNDLIPERFKSEFPVTNEETKDNIKKVLVSLYIDRESVQSYLSDRHIKGVERWSSFEKQNYYMNLFNEFKDLKEIGRFTSDSISTIKKSIIKYQFFMDVFNVIKNEYPDISIEKMDYLPLVNKFMNTLLGNDPEVGLSLCLDENNLKYYCDNTKIALYNKILLFIGEAFLLRKEKSKSNLGGLTKIVSTELNTIMDQKNIIINDTRIPGLFKLIKEYKGILDTGNISEGKDGDQEDSGQGSLDNKDSGKEDYGKDSLNNRDGSKEASEERPLNKNDDSKEGSGESPLNNKNSDKESSEENPLNKNDDGKEGSGESSLNNKNSDKESSEENPLNKNDDGKEGFGESPLNNKNSDKESSEENPLNKNDDGKEGSGESPLNNKNDNKESFGENPLDNRDSSREDPLNKDDDDWQSINSNPGFRPPKTPKNFLRFTDQEASKFKIYGDTNYELKIKSLIYDLSSFPVYKHPYTCALLYRTLLESTSKLVFERYKNNISFKYTEDKLVDNLIYLNDNFLFNNTKNKDIPKIRKAIKKNLTTSNIVDILNLYVHYGYPVDVTLLLSSWNTMKVFIAACLEK